MCCKWNYPLENLPWLVTGNLFRWVYFCRRLQHRTAATGRCVLIPTSPLLRAQVTSRCWRSRFEAWCEGGCIPPISGRIFCWISILQQLRGWAVGGQEGQRELGGWAVHPSSGTGTCSGCAWELLPAGVLSCGSWTSIATIFPCHNSQSLLFFLVLLLKLGDDTC